MIPLLAGVLQLCLYFVLNMGMPYAHGLIPDSIKHFWLQFDSLSIVFMQEEGASNLAPDLQSQIDETLEEITPLYVFELLSLLLAEEYQTKRREGLQGMRNILWGVGGGGAAANAGGLTCEAFMAFLRMTAAEQVELFVATPSNIPAESFEVYGVALALVAQAFMGKKPHLIKDADNLFQQLQQIKVATLANPVYMNPAIDNREMDFALEREIHLIVNFVWEHSKDDKDSDFLPGLCKLLETWLMKVVFPRFRDTNDIIMFKLGDYYDDPTVLRYLESLDGVGGSPLAAATAIVKIGAEATAVLDSVKVSAIKALQKVFPLGKVGGSVKHGEDGQINSSVMVLESEETGRQDQDDSTNKLDIVEENNNDEQSEQEMVAHRIKDANMT
ncbi:hypothetical protein RHSIM_Rhsim03G0065600 [Rhododendron simsii]|uniref:Uncharacterized protein n=1 Tax=Rhododendron simsii TaxID=118357 RepID=A0A834H2M8_RHOSS|nr:hypothetical protein RHSIM_Rhsim03G0065600 [Rhododendron simsii]